MTEQQTGTSRVKRGMAEMLKGGVIMDVVTADQAKIAEDAGAVAVMALERVPADIRAQGGVSRMSDPDMIDGIIAAVSIPVMAKARIGHFVEAQVLQSLGVDYVDESEVLTPADYAHHIDKWAFTVPFVCGATNLGEALRRISEGAAMIRSKGEAGTGDVSNATTHMRQIRDQIRRLTSLPPDELYVAAKELQAPYDLVKEVAEAGKLPVVLFTAGGIATPADAAMMMQLGAEGVFVGSGIFKSGNPEQRAAAIVKATTFFDDPDVIAKVSRGLGEAMVGINVRRLGRGDPRAAPARRARLVSSRPTIGILALQGDVREHAAALAAGGAVARPVRRPSELDGLDGLVIPGGESTTIDKLSRVFELRDPLVAALRAGLPAYGSCAGMIMLADRLVDAPADQQTFGGMDITVRRNAFGRQNDSFESDLVAAWLPGEPFRAVFIRAPGGGRVRSGRRGAGHGAPAGWVRAPRRRPAGESAGHGVPPRGRWGPARARLVRRPGPSGRLTRVR